MANKIEKAIAGLNEIKEKIIPAIARMYGSGFSSVFACEKTEEKINNAIELLKEMKENQPKKGHWVMRHRHRKSVKYVTGIDKCGEEHEIQIVEESEGNEPYCSECGAAAAESFQNFCPKCGADMREDSENE